MSVKVKICGITDEIALDASIEYGAEYVGFVFYRKSPRNISSKRAGELVSRIKNKTKTVAVMVNPDDSEIDIMLKDFKPDYIQLHGDETTERIYDIHMNFSLPVIKAIKIRSSDDTARALNYTNIADMLLFDSKAPTSSYLPGGNGLVFDWTLLRDREFELPWFLSGGLNIENVRGAIESTNAKFVDVSSSIEIGPGKKDPDLIKEFIKRAKSDD